MPRRKDPIDDQIAKGSPGKRLTKRQRQIAEAERLAALLNRSSTDAAEKFAPPLFLTDPRCAGALAIWRYYTPRLAKQNLFNETDCHTFAVFCVTASEYALAYLDVIEHGRTQTVKTVSGDNMLRKNPSVDRLDKLGQQMLDQATRFGLTPLDMARLVRDQAGLPAGGLFTSQQVPVQQVPGTTPAPGTPKQQPQADSNLIGLLDSLDSAPPGSLQ